MIVLVGVGAVAIDVGVWYQSKRAAPERTRTPRPWRAARTCRSRWTQRADGGGARVRARTARPGDLGHLPAVDDLPAPMTRSRSRRPARRQLPRPGVRRSTTSPSRRSPRHDALNNRPAARLPWGVMQGTYMPGTDVPDLHRQQLAQQRGAAARRVERQHLRRQPAAAPPTTASRSSRAPTWSARSRSARSSIPRPARTRARPARASTPASPASSRSARSSRYASGTATLLQPEQPAAGADPGGRERPDRRHHLAQGSGTVRVVGFAWFVDHRLLRQRHDQVDAVYVAAGRHRPLHEPRPAGRIQPHAERLTSGAAPGGQRIHSPP